MFKAQSSKNAQENASIFSGGRLANEGAPVILVVEDDADSRFMLRYMLEMWKYKVIEAGTGSEAVKAAERFNPDLILMDVSLPDTNGFAVARDIRGCANLGGVPVVFLSGYSRNAFGDAAGDAADYFVKPIGADELKNTVGKYCGAALKAA